MILVAPTAFKGTIGAAAAAAALAAGARAALAAAGASAAAGAAATARVVELPLSDGGPGLLDALRPPGAAGTIRSHAVTGPLGGRVEARLLVTSGRWVAESADACGLHLVPPPARDPLRASTAGVGELIRAAAGAPRLVLGLGGSATVDGGTGAARALGWRFLDARGRALPAGGGALHRLRRIVPPPARAPAAPARPLPPITALADVECLLGGPRGAARVFGPQKGADPAAVERLAAGLDRLAEQVHEDVGVAVGLLAGGGAAGGLGAGLVAFAGAELRPGAAWVLEATGFDAALRQARLVVTGEGRFDEQSAMGKLTGTVVARARAAAVPVLVVAGAITVPLPPGVAGETPPPEAPLLDTAGLARLAAAGVTRLLSG
jgi:glycerate 2-kinase